MAHEEGRGKKSLTPKDLGAPSGRPLAGLLDPDSGVKISKFDAAKQHRVIRERLSGLDLINERFARNLRLAVFNLVRRNPDIVSESMRYLTYENLLDVVETPSNVNIVSLKPLEGYSMFVFSPNFIFAVVDAMFGGDGSIIEHYTGRDFSSTENRIIGKLMKLAGDAYIQAWSGVYDIEVNRTRSELHTKFANITNSMNDIVVHSRFEVELGAAKSFIDICTPYSTLEPIRDLIMNPTADSNLHGGEDWTEIISGEVEQTYVTVEVDLFSKDMQLSEVVALKPGDILEFEKPKRVIGRVDGVPVLDCTYGGIGNRRCLKVERRIDHSRSYEMNGAQDEDRPVTNIIADPQNFKES